MLPGNICLRWLSPPYQLGGATLIYATLICVMSTARNYGSVLALRIVIGFVQAFVQGIPLYISLWYTRKEVTTRAAIYFSAATLAGGFSGLIAYGIEENLTLAATGKEPWRWYFIVVGSIALAAGVVLVVALPRNADRITKGKTWLFNPSEVELAVQRLESESQSYIERS